MTVTEFLEARIAEDEELAAPDPDWDNYRGYCDAVGVHYDKARVLAECAAKRAIVDQHERAHRVCVTCEREFPCPTLEIMAAVYADHPDYDKEWAL